MNRTSLAAALALPLAASALVAAAAPAAASGRDGVIASGSCSARSDWELKAKFEDGRIDWEFEVDSNVVGQTWNVTVRDNGVLVFSGSRVTQAPSGSFEIERRTANRAGADSFVARAVNPTTGETCVGRVTI